MLSREKLEELYSITVTNPYFTTFNDKVNKLRTNRNAVGFNSEISHLFFVGMSGVGKSHQAQAYLQQNPPVVTESITERPVVYCEVPHPFKFPQLFKDILYSLGIRRVIGNTRPDDLLEQVVIQLRVHRTEVLLLDEFQHVFSCKEKVKLMDTIKHISNRSGVVIVCTGTTDINILRSDLQLFRRFEILPVPRFDFDDKFLNVLQQFEEKIGLQFCKGLANTDTKIPEVIHKATYGIFHYIKKVVIEAAELAFTANENKVTPTMLKEALAKSTKEFEKNIQPNLQHQEELIRELISLSSSS